MKKTACFPATVFILFVQTIFAQSVHIRFDKTSPQQQYAVSILEKGLLKKGYSIKEPGAAYQINLSINKKSLTPESFTIKTTGKIITITGGDERGLIYGGLSLAEDIGNGIS